MRSSRPTFRLHILGELRGGLEKKQEVRKKAKGHTLITFAEFNESRVVERVSVVASKVEELVRNIRELRGFIEAGDPPLDRRSLVQLGSRLFSLIIQGDVRRLLDRATGAKGDIVPCEVFAEDYEIAGWPWEFLYDDSTHKFLCQELLPISRGIFTLSSHEKLTPKKGKVRLLLVIGVTPNDPDTTSAEEINWIRRVFQTELATEAVEIDILQAVAPEDLDRKLQERRYDILHFFGHARFDESTGQGYLRLDQSTGEPFRFYATDFAQLLEGKGMRLVFLNACESGRADEDQHPGRSSVAAALLDRGIPAVIATQYSIPDVSAHYLSSMIYNAMLSGKPLVESMRDGRRAMSYAKKNQFCDWGIPVLYSSDPDLIVFPPSETAKKPRWVSDFEHAMAAPDVIKSLSLGAGGLQPSVAIPRTHAISRAKRSRVRVALVDIDTKAGFLPDLVEAANLAQRFYEFQVVYIPVPSGVIRPDFEDGNAPPQMFLPRLEPYLSNTPTRLGVDFVCCLTRCMVAGEEDGSEFWNYFAASLDSNSNVIVFSLFDLRDYAREAGVPFAKATLCLCLSMLVAGDPRWNIDYHEKTVGCLFDFCEYKKDIVVGLRKMRFDHAACRAKIKDADQLAAIDALLALEVKSIAKA